MPPPQHSQSQSTYQSASTFRLRINTNSCLSRRNQTMCCCTSSTALSKPKHLTICIDILVEYQHQYLSQPSSHSLLGSAGASNFKGGSARRQAIQTTRSWKSSQRHMRRNTWSFSALSHLTAAWVLFLFPPFGVLVQATSKVTVLAYWMRQ